MRIIGGRARSLPLKTLPGLDTRPTTDRIKETLFNMLQPYLAQANFLDLFAGSGGIGLEAVSRGAKRAVFVEQNRKAAACIRENIRFTRAERESTLLVMDVFAALKRLEQELRTGGQRKPEVSEPLLPQRAPGDGEPFHLVFMDPPYDRGLERQVLAYLKDSPLITEETLLIVEASLKTDFSYLADLGYDVVKWKKYKTNVHLFLRRRTA